jgi:glycosyltransferase involved in cell wall biosynthesis
MQALGCRVVFTAHNPFPHEYKPSDLKRYRRLHRQVDWVIALTDFTRNEIVSRCGVSAEKISVIPHGDFGYIFLQYPRNKTLTEEVRRAAGNRHVITFLGQIRPYKGLEYFIEAFPFIKRQRPDTFFLVAGSMRFGDRKRLEQQLAESCRPDERWVDIRFLPVPDMKAYLSVTDVLVQPYISASQSGNTVMAYAAGIPVISTNVGGLGEMIEDGRTGYIIPPEDAQAIADAVAKCLEGDNLATMSNIARSCAAERYNWQTIAAQTAEVYQRLDEMAKES